MGRRTRREAKIMTSTSAPKFFATRNSTTAWRDEDIAMAHEHWGPFDTADEARAELVKRMRAEAEYLRGGGRAKILRDAADSVEAGNLDDCQRSGLRWQVSNHRW